MYPCPCDRKREAMVQAWRYLLCSPFLYNYRLCSPSLSISFLFFAITVPFFGDFPLLPALNRLCKDRYQSRQHTSKLCLKNYGNGFERCSSTPLPGIRLRYHPGSRVSTAPAYEVGRVTMSAGQHSALAWCSRPGR